jgi:hypothetical protein
MKFGWIPGLRQPLAQLAAICLLVAGCSHAEPEYTQQALSVKGGKPGPGYPGGNATRIADDRVEHAAAHAPFAQR